MVILHAAKIKVDLGEVKIREGDILIMIKSYSLQEHDLPVYLSNAVGMYSVG